jgi:hypothetical protein
MWQMVDVERQHFILEVIPHHQLELHALLKTPHRT